MARVVIVTIVLALLASAQCSGACLVSPCEDSHSCHHTQKKTVQRCEHGPLVADKWTTPQQNPLAVAASFLAARRVEFAPSSPSTPLALSRSPHQFSPPLTALKI